VPTQNYLGVAQGKLFFSGARLPCLCGTELLGNFAEARFADFAFFEPGDLADLNNSAFQDITKWDTFAEHYAACELCHA
jgi:hypothetical protein